jgi:hypothetical protein
MNLDFLKDTGNIVVIIAVVIFYARIMWLRQDMKRKGEIIVAEKKKAGKATGRGSKSSPAGKYGPAVSQYFLNPKYHISNWILGGPGIVLMLVGVIMRTSDWLPVVANPYWYIPAGLGALLLTFSINMQ